MTDTGARRGDILIGLLPSGARVGRIHFMLLELVLEWV